MLHLIIAKYSKSSVSLIETEIMRQLNPYEFNRIKNYKDENKEHRIIGFELIRQQLAYFNQNVSLYDMKRTQYHQPYFEATPFKFSISHSKDYVVCLASISTQLGVDIEFENSDLINLESDYLNDNEKEKLNQDKNAISFFYLHTRKEAIAKALGLGIFIDFKSINVNKNDMKYQNKNWFLTTVSVIDNYTISCATEINNNAVTISRIDF